MKGNTVIVYDLGCTNNHRFEGWFSSLEDYQEQSKSKLLSCPLCGDERVSRVPHASHVSTGAAEKPARAGSAGPASGKPGSRTMASHYANLGSELLDKLIDKVVENTEDVGRAFPEEARKIHYREAPDRHIRGTASVKEVEALRDEGIEVVALPLPPHRLSRTH